MCACSKEELEIKALSMFYSKPALNLKRLSGEKKSRYSRCSKRVKSTNSRSEIVEHSQEQLNCKKGEGEENDKKTDSLKLVLVRVKETNKFKARLKSTIKNQTLDEASLPSSDISETAQSNIKHIEDKEEIAKKNDGDDIIIVDCEPEPIKPREKMGEIKAQDTNATKNLFHNVYAKSLLEKTLLSKLEELYKNYFDVKVQNLIFIIANILIITDISNLQLRSQTLKMKIRTEAEKSEMISKFRKIHAEHQKILKSVFINHFKSIVLSFTQSSDFELTYQMFILGLIKILQITKISKLNKISKKSLKKLVILMLNCLKNAIDDYSKFINMVKSKSFCEECFTVITLIENNYKIDPGIAVRMELFFITEVNDEIFKAVMNAVVNGSSDLESLLKKAAYESFHQYPLKRSQHILSLGISNLASDADEQLVSASGKRVYNCISNINVKNYSGSQPLYTFYEKCHSNTTLLPAVSGLETPVLPGVYSNSPAATTSNSLPTVHERKYISMYNIIETIDLTNDGNELTISVANKKPDKLVNEPEQTITSKAIRNANSKRASVIVLNCDN